jgi:hypothetical protein
LFPDLEAPRLWPYHQNETGADAPASAEKPERAFPLPQIFGVGRGEPAAAKSPQPIQPINLDPAGTAKPVTAQPETRLSPGSAVWEDEMQQLIALIEAEASSWSGAKSGTLPRAELRKQIGLRMLYLIADDPQRAHLAIPGLSADEQEFWTGLFLSLSESLNESRLTDSGERATKTLAQLRNAIHHLRQAAHLELRNVSFCQRINGFGNYEPFELNRFAPGEAVLLYGEIRNFNSEPTMEGLYRTALRSTVEISRVDGDGQVLDRHNFGATQDLCRNLRSDYYHSYQLDLPNHLTRGPHLLKLTIQDEISGKIASEQIRFEVK